MLEFRFQKDSGAYFFMIDLGTCTDGVVGLPLDEYCCLLSFAYTRFRVFLSAGEWQRKGCFNDGLIRTHKSWCLLFNLARILTMVSSEHATTLATMATTMINEASDDGPDISPVSYSAAKTIQLTNLIQSTNMSKQRIELNKQPAWGTDNHGLL